MQWFTQLGDILDDYHQGSIKTFWALAALRISFTSAHTLMSPVWYVMIHVQVEELEAFGQALQFCLSFLQETNCLQWTLLEWCPFQPSLQQFQRVQCIIWSHCFPCFPLYSCMGYMRPFGDISVGNCGNPFPPEFLLQGDTHSGLYLSLRPDSAPGISVHGAGLEVANGIYVRTGFKVGKTRKNCGALKLFVHRLSSPRKNQQKSVILYLEPWNSDGITSIDQLSTATSLLVLYRKTVYTK